NYTDVFQIAQSKHAILRNYLCCTLLCRRCSIFPGICCSITGTGVTCNKIAKFPPTIEKKNKAHIVQKIACNIVSICKMYGNASTIKKNAKMIRTTEYIFIKISLLHLSITYYMHAIYKYEGHLTLISKYL